MKGIVLFLCLAGCSAEQTQKLAEQNAAATTIVCIDEVEYLVSTGFGSNYGGMTVHLKSDGKPFTCKAKS